MSGPDRCPVLFANAGLFEAQLFSAPRQKMIGGAMNAILPSSVML